MAVRMAPWLTFDLWRFAAACLLGMAVVFVLDLGRHVRRRLRGHAGHLVDVLSWFVAASVFFPGLYAALALELRFAVVLGAGMGGLLYVWLASETVGLWFSRRR